jgi:CHASE2 domain-containing sensor protein
VIPSVHHHNGGNLRAFDSRRVREAELHHWITAAILTVVALIVSHYSWMMRARNVVYGLIQRATSTSPFASVVVVLIGDEEFYSPALDHQQPLSREYLASLLDKVTSGNPEVVGVDVEMRSPDPSRAERLNHEKGTSTFVQAVSKFSDRCPIVVAKALSLDAKNTVADMADLLPMKDSIGRGFLNVATDVRQVPLILHVSKNALQSFSLAVVAAKVRTTRGLPSSDHAFPYALFRPPSFFVTVHSRDVPSAQLPDLKKWFAHRIVLIGGDWGLRSKGGDERIDIVPTPVGDIPGVYVHATYIESLLHGTMREMPGWVKTTVELLIASTMSILFTASRGVWRITTVLGGTFFILLLTFFFWQNLGMFFEAFVPTVLLGGHVLGEQVFEWKEQAAKVREP